MKIKVDDIDTQIKASSFKFDNHEDIQLAAANQELQYRHDLISAVKTEHTDRRKYALWIFIFVSSYLLSATLIMVFNGGLFGLHLHIKDDVMMVFLGTTVINVIGLLMGVIRYLFPRQMQLHT